MAVHRDTLISLHPEVFASGHNGLSHEPPPRGIFCLPGFTLQELQHHTVSALNGHSSLCAMLRNIPLKLSI